MAAVFTVVSAVHFKGLPAVCAEHGVESLRILLQLSPVYFPIFPAAKSTEESAAATGAGWLRDGIAAKHAGLAAFYPFIQGLILFGGHIVFTELVCYTL